MAPRDREVGRNGLRLLQTRQPNTTNGHLHRRIGRNRTFQDFVTLFPACGRLIILKVGDVAIDLERGHREARLYIGTMLFAVGLRPSSYRSPMCSPPAGRERGAISLPQRSSANRAIQSSAHSAALASLAETRHWVQGRPAATGAATVAAGAAGRSLTKIFSELNTVSDVGLVSSSRDFDPTTKSKPRPSRRINMALR